MDKPSYSCNLALIPTNMLEESLALRKDILKLALKGRNRGMSANAFVGYVQKKVAEIEEELKKREKACE